MTIAATSLTLQTLAHAVAPALLAGTGVTVAFSTVIYGVDRASELRRGRRLGDLHDLPTEPVSPGRGRLRMPHLHGLPRFGSAAPNVRTCTSPAVCERRLGTASGGPAG